MVSHWILIDRKSPQVSRTLLSILVVLTNAVLWMIFTRLPTSNSSSPFSNPLVTVPNAPITIGIIVTCMFHCFFNSLARSRYLSFFSHFFQFYCVVSRDMNIIIIIIILLMVRFSCLCKLLFFGVFFADVWVAACLLISAGHFWVFKPILSILQLGLSWFFLWFSISLVSFPSNKEAVP